jgi:signal transduction histidine kinase
MKIPTFDDFKRAVAMSTHAQTTKRNGEPEPQSMWRAVAWPLALACCFLIFDMSSASYLVLSSQSASESGNHAVQVENKLFVVLVTVRNAESGQRGYLVTGELEFLNVYQTATDAIQPAVADLKREITGNPTYQKAFVEIEPLLDRKFAEMAETIRLYDAGNSAAAAALVRTGVGRDLMAEIGDITSNIAEEQRRLLSVRESSTASVNRWLLAVNLIGFVLIIVLAVISVLVLRRLAKKELAYRTELERSNQELDDFAYIASHDLKEPLRGLFNHASFLLEDYRDKLDDDGVRRLNRLGQLCQRMEGLINDLMYFSRLGRAELAAQVTDPNAVVAEIQQMMEQVLGERNARIVMPRSMPQIVCDKARVTEVFRNLISNAVKYNDKPEPRVEIGFLAAVDTAAGVASNVFYVKDNGVGIEPEFHQEIFRIFKRLQGPADGQDAGTGVGLTFVKKIVERHGGRIWLESEPRKGTIFYFNLNLEVKKQARKTYERAIVPLPIHSAG